MRRPAPILLLALAAQACSDLNVPPPVLGSVEPSAVPNAPDADLAVLGDNFYADVTFDFDHPDQSRVSAAFGLELVHPNGRRFPLSGVTLLSAGQLAGTLPAGAPPQTYDLWLVDPRGQVAVLRDALQVYQGDCSVNGSPCLDGNTCTFGDTCQGRYCQAGTPVPDGTACQLVCASPVETCQAGECTPPPGGCP
jgi:hypothetical protein